jgi:hypothetical protein
MPQQEMSNISKIFFNSKKSAKQLLIDKLEDYLQKSKEQIEELEDKVSFYEAIGLETARKFNNFCKRILEIYGINQTIGTDKQLLDIITEYKTSSESLRQKYENLCASIATLAQTIGEQPIDGRTDANSILSSIEKLFKDKETYCQILKEKINEFSEDKTQLDLEISGDEIDIKSQIKDMSPLIEELSICNEVKNSKEMNVELIESDRKKSVSKSTDDSKINEVVIQLICDLLNILSLEEKQNVGQKFTNKSIDFSNETFESIKSEDNETRLSMCKTNKESSSLEYQSLYSLKYSQRSPLLKTQSETGFKDSDEF